MPDAAIKKAIDVVDPVYLETHGIQIVDDMMLDRVVAVITKSVRYPSCHHSSSQSQTSLNGNSLKHRWVSRYIQRCIGPPHEPPSSRKLC